MAEDYSEYSKEELIQKLKSSEVELERSELEKSELLEKSSRESLRSNELLNVIIPLGTALSAEKDLNTLLKMILDGAMGICHADGGTVYIKNGSKLEFKVIQNETLMIKWADDDKMSNSRFESLSIYDEQTGDVNTNNVATLAASNGVTVNIEDAYESKEFDFSGTKIFDKKNKYRSMSFLTVPLKNYSNDVIGVLQLINARTERRDQIIPFSKEKQTIVESLSSLAASALDNQMLLQAQKDLLDAFIRLISDAIDQKSPYTGGHCKRVPYITELLAKAAIKQEKGPFFGFDLNEDQMYELKTAAWLHDIGKITTPEYVVDKATKLETIFDRIELIESRFATLKEQIMQSSGSEEDKTSQIEKLRENLEFIKSSNLGGEFMSAESKELIKEVSELKYRDFQGREQPMLTDDEVYNLLIERGTLTNEERQIINNHIVVTIDMLEKLPFPDHLKRIPEYAGGHHEKMDGTGYPKGLTREQMSVPARIMAIADIFEALTASDRPYKKGKKLSEAIRIMNFMKKDHHIDAELFELFLKEELYKPYAKEFLKKEQIDEIDVSQYLN
jgi:HD-GYP domain-containing protein (c-di-GMP phosphodiesterase class II)